MPASTVITESYLDESGHFAHYNAPLPAGVCATDRIWLWIDKNAFDSIVTKGKRARYCPTLLLNYIRAAVTYPDECHQALRTYHPVSYALLRAAAKRRLARKRRELVSKLLEERCLVPGCKFDLKWHYEKIHKDEAHLREYDLLNETPKSACTALSWTSPRLLVLGLALPSMAIVAASTVQTPITMRRRKRRSDSPDTCENEKKPATPRKRVRCSSPKPTATVITSAKASRSSSSSSAAAATSINAIYSLTAPRLRGPDGGVKVWRQHLLTCSYSVAENMMRKSDFALVYAEEAFEEILSNPRYHPFRQVYGERPLRRLIRHASSLLDDPRDPAGPRQRVSAKSKDDLTSKQLSGIALLWMDLIRMSHSVLMTSTEELLRRVFVPPSHRSVVTKDAFLLAAETVDSILLNHYRDVLASKSDDLLRPEELLSPLALIAPRLNVAFCEDEGKRVPREYPDESKLLGKLQRALTVQILRGGARPEEIIKRMRHACLDPSKLRPEATLATLVSRRPTALASKMLRWMYWQLCETMCKELAVSCQYVEHKQSAEDAADLVPPTVDAATLKRLACSRRLGRIDALFSVFIVSGLASTSQCSNKIQQGKENEAVASDEHMEVSRDDSLLQHPPNEEENLPSPQIRPPAERECAMSPPPVVEVVAAATSPLEIVSIIPPTAAASTSLSNNQCMSQAILSGCGDSSCSRPSPRIGSDVDLQETSSSTPQSLEANSAAASLLLYAPQTPTEGVASNPEAVASSPAMEDSCHVVSPLVPPMTPDAMCSPVASPEPVRAASDETSTSSDNANITQQPASPIVLTPLTNVVMPVNLPSFEPSPLLHHHSPSALLYRNSVPHVGVGINSHCEDWLVPLMMSPPPPPQPPSDFNRPRAKLAV